MGCGSKTDNVIVTERRSWRLGDGKWDGGDSVASRKQFEWIGSSRVDNGPQNDTILSQWMLE
jgi:hypothetical protein